MEEIARCCDTKRANALREVAMQPSDRDLAVEITVRRSTLLAATMSAVDVLIENYFLIRSDNVEV